MIEEDLLEAMIEACEKGIVTWETTVPNYFWTSSEGWTLGMHHVPRGDGESFRDILEVGAGGVSLHYYRGTKGYELAGKLLDFAAPEFGKHRILINERIESELSRIRTALLSE